MKTRANGECTFTTFNRKRYNYEGIIRLIYFSVECNEFNFDISFLKELYFPEENVWTRKYIFVK